MDFSYDPVTLSGGFLPGANDVPSSVKAASAALEKASAEAVSAAAAASAEAEEMVAARKAERKKMLLYVAAGFAVFVCILALIKRK